MLVKGDVRCGYIHIIKFGPRLLLASVACFDRRLVGRIKHNTANWHVAVVTILAQASGSSQTEPQRRVGEGNMPLSEKQFSALKES